MFKCSFQTNAYFLEVNIRNPEVKIQEAFYYCLFENHNWFNNPSNVTAVLWYLNTAPPIINVHRNNTLYKQLHSLIIQTCVCIC